MCDSDPGASDIRQLASAAEVALRLGEATTDSDEVEEEAVEAVAVDRDVIVRYRVTPGMNVSRCGNAVT